MKRILIFLLLVSNLCNAQRLLMNGYKHATPPSSFTTLDPAKNSTYINLSGGNLIATGNNTFATSSMCLSVLGKTVGTSGNVHCEFQLSATGSLKFGLATSATSLDAQPQNNDAFAWSLKPDGFWVNASNFNSYPGFSYTTSQWAGMDVNLATGAVSFSVNGTLVGSTAFTLPAGTYYVAVGFYQENSVSITCNFGASAWNSNPNGYSGWQ